MVLTAVSTLVSSVIPIIALHQFSTALVQMGIGLLRVRGKQVYAHLHQSQKY